MKKITITMTDSAFSRLSLNEVVSSCITFHVETIPDKGAPQKSKHRDPDGMTINSCIMSHYGDHSSKEFSIEQARAWLTEKGFSASSASPACSQLMQQEYIAPVKRGRFIFLKSMENG